MPSAQNEPGKGSKWRIRALYFISCAPMLFWFLATYSIEDCTRKAYGLNNPSRYTDPSGHSVCDLGKYADPECKGLRISKRPEPPNPPVEPSSDLSSQLMDDKSDDKDNDLPFDPSVGGNFEDEEHDLGLEQDSSSDERPSVVALIAIGVPLTMAIAFVEVGLTWAEIDIAKLTLAAPELAPFTIPGELILTGSSLALIDIEIAYWSYTYRVAFTPEGEPVKFKLLYPWGFDK